MSGLAVLEVALRLGELAPTSHVHCGELAAIVVSVTRPSGRLSRSI
jgi:hypothetical protein